MAANSACAQRPKSWQKLTREYYQWRMSTATKDDGQGLLARAAYHAHHQSGGVRSDWARLQYVLVHVGKGGYSNGTHWWSHAGRP